MGAAKGILWLLDYQDLRRRAAAAKLTNSRRLMPGMGAPSQVPPPIIAGRNRQAQAV